MGGVNKNMGSLTVTEFARLGGKARAKALSKERIHEIAVNAGNANLKKYGADYFKNIRKGIKVSEMTLDK
jgi:hypothetical protein